MGVFRKLFALPLAAQILVGLAIGAVIGLALPSAGTVERVDDMVAVLSVGGQLWLRALQMTILPLVFALLSTLFLRTQGLSGGGRATRRAITVIIGLYLLGIPLGILSTYGLLWLFPINDDMAQALRAMAGEGIPSASVPWADAVLSFVPNNIVAAMGSGNLLPVLFFSLVFGAALAKLEDGKGKETLVAALTGLADVIFIIVNWVLRFAPLGVALLILPTTHNHGTDVFAGLAHNIGLSVAQILMAIAVIYLIAVTVGRIPLDRFAKAMLPTQSVAIGTQSSTGCMPLTIKSCREMGISEAAIDATVPMAAVIFRFIAPWGFLITSIYAAQVYELPPLSIGTLLMIGVVGILIEMSKVGLPAAATFLASWAPMAALVGFPIEFVVVLLVVETIPDIFKTVLNVTAHATAAVLVDRHPELTSATESEEATQASLT